jgi:hypothetical protein
MPLFELRCAAVLIWFVKFYLEDGFSWYEDDSILH